MNLSTPRGSQTSSFLSDNESIGEYSKDTPPLPITSHLHIDSTPIDEYHERNPPSLTTSHIPLERTSIANRDIEIRKNTTKTRELTDSNRYDDTDRYNTDVIDLRHSTELSLALNNISNLDVNVKASTTPIRR